MKDESTDALALLAAKTATYGGGTSAFIFGLTANEVAALGGLAIGVIGLIVQIYFNRKRDKRETAEHSARMERWRDER